MQPKAEIEKSYEIKDPWNYQKNPSDTFRKNTIIAIANLCGEYKNALDIGCGEGWITQDLPAEKKWGYEISDNAAHRFPPNVNRLANPRAFGRVYDLVVATGVLYAHYDWRTMLDIITTCASGVVIISGISGWLVPEVYDAIKATADEVLEMRFPYHSCGNEYTQQLTAFRVRQ